MIRSFSILLVASAAACAPMVTHGPRVQPGVTLSVTSGSARELCDSTCRVDLTPQVSLGASRGWAATDTRPGFSFGANISIFSSDADVYVQAPTGWTGAMQAGAGVLAGIDHAMPYVQLGRMGPDGAGWYTTQGVAWIFRRPARHTLFDDEDEASGDPALVQPLYWAPTVALRSPGRTGFSVYVSGAFGSADAWEYNGEGDLRRAGRERIRSVMVGITLDTQAERPVARMPSTPPAPPAPSASTLKSN